MVNFNFLQNLSHLFEPSKGSAESLAVQDSVSSVLFLGMDHLHMTVVVGNGHFKVLVGDFHLLDSLFVGVLSPARHGFAKAASKE